MNSTSKRCFVMLALCLMVLVVKQSSAEDAQEQGCIYTDQDEEFCKTVAVKYENIKTCFVDDRGNPLPFGADNFLWEWTIPLRTMLNAFKLCPKTCLCGNCQ